MAPSFRGDARVTVMVLAANHLNFAWQMQKTVRAVTDFSAEFHGGIPHFICGPSGSGKTTLGYLLSGLQKPDSGSVDLDHAMPGESVRAAFVFQFAENLFFEDTVADEVKQISGNNAARAQSIFSRLGVDLDTIASLSPFRLSAGYSRLVATGLQMARDPRVLILDEPTIGLDWRFNQQMTDALIAWMNPARILIVITHDLDLMHSLGGQTWAMADGRLVWNGATETLLKDDAMQERFALRC